MFRSFALVFSFLFVISSGLSAQSWRASLYPEDWTPPTNENKFYTDEFVQDFSYAGYHLGEDAIPDVTNNIVDVTAPPYNADPTGTTDATLAIQSALDAVGTAGGGVVFLPAGTYNVSVRDGESSALHIAHSNVVLRGAGTGQTFIYNTTDTGMRLNAIIRIEANSGRNWDRLPDAGDFANITTDLEGPVTEIPLDNPGRFSVGDEVIVRSLITDNWCDEHNEEDWKPFSTILDGLINFRVVTAVSDTSITIDVPTRYAFMMADGAMVYPAFSEMLSEVGLEYFSIGNKEIVSASPADWLEGDGTLDNSGYRIQGAPAYDLHASSAIKMDRTRDSWIRNVSSYRHPDNQFGTHILSNGIKLEFSARVTIDSCFMGFAQFGGGGGNAYGYRIESNDCLISNCSAEALRHGFVFARIWSLGNVLHRVTDRVTGRCTANETELIRTGSSGSDFHQWFSPSNLIDQMTVDQSYYSAVHREGVAASATRPGHDAVTAHSVFWNFIADQAPNGYAIRTSQTKAGYVFGTGGSTPGVNNSPDDPVNLLNLGVFGNNPAFRYDVGAAITMPLDLVEGVGMATTLEPQSLYLDQLDRRMNPVSTRNVAISPADPNIFPNPSVSGVFRMSVRHNWRVMNLNGQEITAGNGSTVNLAGKARGIYLLRTEVGVSRLVIQ